MEQTLPTSIIGTITLLLVMAPTLSWATNEGSYCMEKRGFS